MAYVTFHVPPVGVNCLTPAFHVWVCCREATRGLEVRSCWLLIW